MISLLLFLFDLAQTAGREEEGAREVVDMYSEWFGGEVARFKSTGVIKFVLRRFFGERPNSSVIL